MSSLTGNAPQRCDGCLNPSSDLRNHAGDKLCPACRAVFWTATVLFDQGITREDEVIATLVLAKRTGRPDPGFPGLEVVRIVDDVRIVKIRPVVVEPMFYPETDVLKLVRVQITSRAADLDEIQEDYERLLERHGARWNENNHGRISHDFTRGYLEMVVDTGEELSSAQVKGLGGDPLRHPALHFPPADLVAAFCRSVIGSARGPNQRGFAFALDSYGKGMSKTPEKLIPAFVAWHVGADTNMRVPPESRPRVARILNTHLLGPCDKPRLPVDGWSPSDTVWRDVKDLWWLVTRLYAGGPANIKPLSR